MANSEIGKSNAALKAALEARKKTSDTRSPEQEQLAREMAEREALLAEVFAIPDQAERRRLLDSVGLSHISAASKPIEPIKGSAHRVPMPQQRSEPIDWQFWVAMPHVQLWQACALAVGLNPDKLKPHPQGWMAGSGATSAVMLDPRSFPNEELRGRFEKALRLACAGVSYMDGPIRPRGPLIPSHASRKDVLLSDVAMFLTKSGVAIPQEMQELAKQHEQLLDDEATTHDAQGSNEKRRWSSEKLEELASYRKTHGTKAAAEKFQVSEARVRQLLPGEDTSPKGFSAFNQQGKKR